MTDRRVANDLAIYERCAADWWDPGRPTFRSLHSATEHHLRELADAFGDRLDGATCIDLGCGGGLLAIPLAERGATVIGVDRSPASLRAAAAEAQRRGVRCTFVCADLRSTGLPDSCADQIVMSDVLEHVDEPARAIAELARLLRPGGRAYVNTINRTRRAAWLAIVVAEGLGYVPHGTHDARLFVRPAELDACARAAGLVVVRFRGSAPRVWATVSRRALVMRSSTSLAVAYSAILEKVRP